MNPNVDTVAEVPWWTFWREDNKRWICAYKNSEGKLRQKVIPPAKAATPRDERAAQRWAASYVQDLHQGGDRSPEPQPEPALSALPAVPETFAAAAVRPAAPLTSAVDHPVASPARAFNAPVSTAAIQPLAAPSVTAAIPAPTTGTRRLRELAPLWIALAEKNPKVSPATLAGYKTHLELSILPKITEDEPALGDLTPGELTVARLRAWVRTLRDTQKLQATTLRNRLSTLSKFISAIRAEDWAKLEMNVAKDEAVRAELPELPVYDVEILSPWDFGLLIGCNDVPDVRKIRYMIAALTGLADGEIAGLRLRSLCLTPGAETLKVRAAVALIGPDGHATEKGPKNKYRLRTIPLPPVLADALRWWVDEGWAIYVRRAPTPTDFVLPGESGSASRPKSAKLLRKDLRSAGVEAPSGFQFKTLRACFASWLEDTGASEACIGRLMGHRGKTTAARHYTATMLASDRQAVAKIPCPPFAASVVRGLVRDVVRPVVRTLEVEGGEDGVDDENLAPPAGIGPATFGLGNDWSSLRRPLANYREQQRKQHHFSHFARGRGRAESGQDATGQDTTLPRLGQQWGNRMAAV